MPRNTISPALPTLAPASDYFHLGQYPRAELALSEYRAQVDALRQAAVAAHAAEVRRAERSMRPGHALARIHPLDTTPYERMHQEANYLTRSIRVAQDAEITAQSVATRARPEVPSRAAARSFAPPASVARPSAIPPRQHAAMPPMAQSWYNDNSDTDHSDSDSTSPSPRTTWTQPSFEARFDRSSVTTSAYDPRESQINRSATAVPMHHVRGVGSRVSADSSTLGGPTSRQQPPTSRWSPSSSESGEPRSPQAPQGSRFSAGSSTRGESMHHQWPRGSHWSDSTQASVSASPEARLTSRWSADSSVVASEPRGSSTASRDGGPMVNGHMSPVSEILSYYARSNDDAS